MAYKALYRAFRPRRFEDLKGQEVTSAILKNQVRTGSPSHAYLFSGPRGTGKTTTAKIFASALNCLDLQDGEPCLACVNCKAALNDSFIDIVEMDAASNNGVDHARDIRDKAGLLPASGKYKVYIIDEVHMLTGAAFNALLKTLEEPPAHVVFILATTELDALPKTVLSRCQRFDFKLIEDTEIVTRLNEVLQEVGATAENAALTTIAKAAGGGLRDALTILEKCIAVDSSITDALVSSVLGQAQKDSVERLLNAIGHYDAKETLLTLSELIDGGIEPSTLLFQLLEGYEGMLFALVTGTGAETLLEPAENIGQAGIVRGIDVLSETAARMRFAPRQAILLEAAVLRLLLPEGEPDGGGAERLSKIERRLERLESGQLSAPAAKNTSIQTSTERAGSSGVLQSEQTERAMPKHEASTEETDVPWHLSEEENNAMQGNAPEPKQNQGAAERIHPAVEDDDALERGIDAAKAAYHETKVRGDAKEGEAWQWLLGECSQDVSMRPILNGLTLKEEQGASITLTAANPMIRLMFENGGLKAQMEEKLREKYNTPARVVLEEAPIEQNKLYQAGGIDIID